MEELIIQNVGERMINEALKVKVTAVVHYLYPLITEIKNKFRIQDFNQLSLGV